MLLSLGSRIAVELGWVGSSAVELEELADQIKRTTAGGIVLLRVEEFPTDVCPAVRELDATHFLRHRVVRLVAIDEQRALESFEILLRGRGRAAWRDAVPHRVRHCERPRPPALRSFRLH